MNATVQELAPCKKLLRVEVEPEKVEQVFDEVTKDFQREARLPGFRPGKAPKDMVLKRFESDIQIYVKKKLMSEAFKQAVEEQKLSVVGQPDIEEIQFSRGQALQFAATLETAPDLALPPYKGMPVRREKAMVTPADLQRAMEALRQRKVTFQAVARELKPGDMAVVNYTGSCEGRPITELAPAARGLTEKKNFWVPMEPDSFIPGFAMQLAGMKAGEQRTVTVNFPADFVTPQLAGKQGAYQVQLVEVKEKVLPELNDEFAKSFQAASLEALRESLRADLQNELNLRQARSLREQVVRGLLEKIQCDLPESLVEQETRSIVYSIVQENQKRGLSKEILDAQKDAIYAGANANAKERVKARFVFSKIAEQEGVRVSEEELKARIVVMASEHKMPPDQLVKALEKSGALQNVYDDLVHEKVIELLVQNATITN